MGTLEMVEYSALEEALSAGMTDETKKRIFRALGSSGMLAVHNVPSVQSLRGQLLPLAPVLALMPESDRRVVLKNNGLGTDVSLKRPDRVVSSFATQLLFGRAHTDCQKLDATALDHHGLEMVKTGQIFRQLGCQLIELGLMVARICDAAIPDLGLESTILGAQTAKGRLIHYHSQYDSFISKTVGKDSKKNGDAATAVKLIGSDPCSSEMWQQWHYDYGVLTLVTSPMFFRPSESVAASAPDGHSSLVAMDNSTGSVQFVDIPQDCVLIQVGEAAQILSGGKLRATAHCVVKPAQDSKLSRETFVVFLQPAWDKILAPSAGSDIRMGTSESKDLKNSAENEQATGKQPSALLDAVIPPLDSRWKEGWTFAEFSKETTRQYYGSSGIQSNR